jgi:cyclic beta-1,2-glucan synthetase
MYRVGLEGILGLRKRGEMLFIEPHIPADWREYTIEYRAGRSLYVIVVHNERRVELGGPRLTMDGQVLPGPGIPLVDDGARHDVLVRLAPPRPA